jgi:DNA repair protein RadC
MKMRTVPVFSISSGSVRKNPDHKYRIPRYKVGLVREGTAQVPDRVVNGPRVVYDIFKEIFAEADREYFYILCLDVKNKIIGLNMVSMGTLNASVVHTREVFKAAILLNSASIVGVHNHPSGAVDPSGDDLNITRALVAAGKILGIPFVDHMIIGQDGYLSIMETYPELRG